MLGTRPCGHEMLTDHGASLSVMYLNTLRKAMGNDFVILATGIILRV